MGHKINHPHGGSHHPAGHHLIDEPYEPHPTGGTREDFSSTHFSPLDWPLYEPYPVWPRQAPVKAQTPVVLPETGPYRLFIMIATLVFGISALVGLVFSQVRMGHDSPVPIESTPMKFNYDRTGSNPSQAALFQQNWAPFGEKQEIKIARAKKVPPPAKRFVRRIPLEEIITAQLREQFRQTVVLADLIILDSRLIIQDNHLALEDK